MEKVVVTKKNETYIRISSEPPVLQELSDLFTFDVPNAQHHPKVKAKMWDGKIRLFSAFTGELYLGLLPHVYKFCVDNGYEFVDNCELIRDEVTIEEVGQFVDALPLSAHGETIAARKYQIDAIYQAIHRGRVLLLSPTGSGKSLVIYACIRWHQTKGRKQLIIVPTTSLVSQMYKDFDDYASEDVWSSEQYCTKVYSGQDKDYSKDVIISTWQSLSKMPKLFFSQFGVIYGDEAHLCTAKSLTDIFKHCINAPFKIGTTGTLDGTKCHRLVLEGLFGAVYKATTTKQLMDDNQLAALKIHGIVLQYPAAECKMVANKKKEYAEEIDFLISHPYRNQFICNLALDLKGNTLLLFQFVEKHGRILHDMISEAAAEGRKVFFVHGGIDAEEREEVRAITEKETDAIIVASSGVFSQGVNVRNLHNIIFASPTKSRIRNLQSLGRGLRIGDDKDMCNLYDIGDDLSWKSRQNYALSHFIERITIYAQENFEYTIVSIPLVG